MCQCIRPLAPPLLIRLQVTLRITLVISRSGEGSVFRLALNSALFEFLRPSFRPRSFAIHKSPCAQTEVELLPPAKSLELGEQNQMKLWPIALLLLISVAAIPAAADSTDTWNFATTHNQSLGTTPIAVMELASLRLAQAISTTNSREASAAPARPASVWPAATATTRSTRPLHHSQPQQPVSKSVTGVSLMGSIQRSETGQVCDAFDSCVTFGSGSDSNSVSIFGLFTDIKNHHSGFSPSRLALARS